VCALMQSLGAADSGEGTWMRGQEREAVWVGVRECCRASVVAVPRFRVKGLGFGLLLFRKLNMLMQCPSRLASGCALPTNGVG